jgi:hypothetical protein
MAVLARRALLAATPIASAIALGGLRCAVYAARLETLASVARLEPVTAWIAVHDMPERSIPGMPALRELKKVSTPGCGQARGKPARSRARHLQLRQWAKAHNRTA